MCRSLWNGIFYKLKIMILDNFLRDLEAVRTVSPLVHNITNYVVMNNTANALLAIGASPVMAHSLPEVTEMAGIASSVVLNIGTLEPDWTEAMVIAGMTAKSKGTPVVLDPVGAGATSYRTRVCRYILQECRPDVIRGNASEIIALLGADAGTKGVDSTASSDIALDSAKTLASQYGAVVVISGATDYVTDGENVATVVNGSPLMARVTGMGCTASAVTGAFTAVNKDTFEAALHAMALMGVAGEIAASRSEGPGSMQANFLDVLYGLDGEAVRNTLSL